MDDEHGKLEDLSQDVHLFGNIRLTQIHWLVLGAAMGFVLAAIPAPPALRLVFLALPLVVTILFLQLDGPVWLRRYFAYRRRGQRPTHLDAPHVQAFAQAATPICDLGVGFSAAAEIHAPPYRLADARERERRTAAWIALFNAAAAQGVQIDVFTAHGPMGDIRALPGANATFEDIPPALRDIAVARLNHWIRDAAMAGYETRVVVRLTTGVKDAGQAWQRFQACRSAFVGSGGGLGWEWVAGSYLWTWSMEWIDPGAATRRFVWDGQRVLDELRGKAG